jgi:hypothetical protein
MTVRSKSGLTAYITGVLPDNNAGLISAADVRNSMIDIVDSINQIVASGNFNSETPFVNHVRLQHQDGAGGILYVGSGITFTNGGGTQYVPYPGSTGIAHNSLDGLNTGDPHTQYLPIAGTRTATGDIGLGVNWINSSGSRFGATTGRGLQFQYAGTNSKETINVGSGTSFVYFKDYSEMNSARGVAKAWIRFEGSGTGGGGSPVVRDAYNVSGIRKDGVGKFTIIFNSGVFKDNYYVAIGSSNARSTAANGEDFSQNTVATSYRTGNDASSLRSVSFRIQDDGGTYCDGLINDLVVFGTEPAGSGYASSVTVTNVS